MPKLAKGIPPSPLFVFFLLLAFAFPSLYAQDRFLENSEPTIRGSDGGLFLDVPTRTKIDLAGTWKYSIDGKTWQQVKIPSAYDFVERVTFVRTFEVPSQFIGSSSFALVAYGINYESEIWINDIFIGKHFGGYATFIFHVPENVLQVGKENSIKVIVNNALNAKDTLPLRQQVWGWRNYGGILRDIYLLARPKVWIDDVQVEVGFTPDFHSATVGVSVAIDNAFGELDRTDTVGINFLKSSEFVFYAGVYDKLSGKFIEESDEEEIQVGLRKVTRVEAEIKLPNPKFWSPEKSDLYVLKSYLLRDGEIFDEVDMNFGVRQVVLTNGEVYLNGSKVVLRGISWQEDHPLYGSALTYEAMEKDVVMIKSLGANLIRFAYHPPHPYLLDLCDRYGLFAMEEIPVWNVPAEILGKEYYQELARGYLKEMIQRDRNHPSVFAWGIGNEFDSSEMTAKTYVKEMQSLSKSLDDRPTYYCSSMIHNDICASDVDIAAFAISTMDLKLFKTKISEWKKNHPYQPILLAKYGKEVELGNRNGYSDPMSVESQAKYFVQRYEVIHDARIAGSVIWAFADWRGDRPIITIDHGDHYLYTMGLVSYAREKRLAYEVVKALFSGEKITALSMGTYSQDSPISFVIVGLLLLLFFAYLLNSNRQFRENVSRSFLRPYNFFADVRDHRALSYFQTTLLGFVVSVTLALVSSSILVHYRSSKLMDYVITHFLISDQLKSAFATLLWNPLKCALYFTMLFILGLMFLSLLVRFFSFFMRTKIYFFHAYSVALWSTLPFVLFIPIGMILYRIIENGPYVVPVLIFVSALCVWVIYRLLKSVAIVYDVMPVKVYAGGILIFVALLGVVLLYYNSTQSTFAYFTFVKNMIEGAG